MNMNWLENILTIVTSIVSLGVAIFSIRTYIDTRKKSYKEFIENREKRKTNEKN